MRPAFIAAAACGPTLLASLVVLGAYAGRGVDAVGAPRDALQSRSTSRLPDLHLIVYDELSLMPLLHENTLDERLVPNLASLSRQATWYRNAITNYDITTYAVPALCTGNLAAGPRSSRNSSVETPSLFRKLLPYYQINMVSDWRDCEEFAGDWHSCYDSSNLRDPSLAFAAIAIGYLESLPTERFIPARVSAWGNGAIKSSQMLNSRRFAELAPSATAPPTFNYLHTLLTHFPWAIDDRGNFIAPPYTWISSPDDAFAATLLERYRASIAYSDRQLGDYFNRLKQAGRFDNAMIVVVSDHGTSFDLDQPGRMRGETDDWVVRVPLIVKLPKQREGRVDDSPISLVDVAPLVLDTLGLQLDGAQPKLVPARRVNEAQPFFGFVYNRTPWGEWFVPYRVDVGRGIYERTQ
jgi:hypothetical protein